MAGKKFSWDDYETTDQAPAKGSKFSWDDYPPVEEQKEKGLGDSIVENVVQPVIENVVVPVGQAIDRFTGAPSRAAVGAAQDGKNPVSAFAEQFGEDPEKAPTGKDLARKMGFSGNENDALSSVLPSLYSATGDEWLKLKKGGVLDPTPAGAAGLALDVATDWTNLVPAKALASASAKAAKQAIPAIGKGAVKAADATISGAAKAADLATGTKLATQAIDSAKQVATKTGDDLSNVARQVLVAKQSPEYARYVEIAKANGIDPNSLSAAVEFGPYSNISRAKRTIAESPIGEDYRLDHSAASDAIDSATQKRIKDIAGGAANDPISGGLAVRDGFEAAKNNVLGSDKLTYDSVRKYAPGLTIPQEQWAALNSKLNGIEKWAKGTEGLRSSNQAFRSKAKEVLDTVQSIRASGGKSYKQFNELRDGVGKIAFADPMTFSGTIAPNQEKLADLYFAMRDTMLETVNKHVSPEFAKEIADNNKVISEFLSDIKSVNKELSSGTVSETKLLNSVLSNPKKASTFLKWAPKEAANQARSAYLNQIFDNAKGWDSLKESLRRNRETVMTLYSPQEIKAIEDLAELGSVHGPWGINPSGTAVVEGWRKLVQSVGANSVVKRVLENRIAKARAAGIDPSGAAKAAKSGASVLSNESGQVSSDLVQQLLGSMDPKRFAGKRTSPIAQAGKAAQVASVQSTGENKWAMDGASKLGIGEDQASGLMQSKEAKRLLIEASDLPEGSAKLQKIKQRILEITGE